MKKSFRVIAIAIILSVAVFILSGCQNTENSTNKANENTSTNNSTSLRDQIMGQANMVNTITNIQSEAESGANAKLEDLEKYNKEEDSTYKTYTAENGASFIYPSNWVSVGTKESPAFMAPDTKGASVNISEDTIDKSNNIVTDFDGYIAMQKLYLVQQMTMLTDIEQKVVNLNGRKAYILDYETETEQNGNTIQLHVIQTAFEDDGEVSILTLAVIRNYYNDLKPTFEKITKSFMK